ncbi:MAG: hypothetical protein ACJ76S_03150 [Solirubrobacteraceae bacterium]|jgi:hypothetical protein
MLRVIRRRVRRQKGGVNLVADVDAAVAANTGSSGQRQRVKVRNRHSVVQRSSRARRDDPAEPRAEQKEEP